jgi:hypothetical protein
VSSRPDRLCCWKLQRCGGHDDQNISCDGSPRRSGPIELGPPHIDLKKWDLTDVSVGRILALSRTFRLGRANAPGRSLTCPFACHQGAQRLAGQGVAEGHREATRSALGAQGVRP